MVGNRAVNIGGGTINIAGSNNPDNTNESGYTSGGINIVSSIINFTKNASNDSSIEN